MLCLKVATDARWAEDALRRLDDLLVDHAHCEMKAASNALSLAVRHGEDAELVRALTDLAKEEIDHFQRVLAILASRGVALRPPSVDTYAADLREGARELGSQSAKAALVDRLLVGALIEARSCERFKLLVDAAGRLTDAGAAEARALWNELFAAEAGHYRTFVDLAARVAGGDREGVVARLERLAEIEARIVRGQSRGSGAVDHRATIHG